MPTYQYVCTECGTDLEVVQKFSDPSLTDCPQCQGRLRKVFNAVGVVFKGSGFYRTDSRAADGGESKANGAKVKEPQESGGGGGGKETKESSTTATKETGAKGPKESGTSGSGSNGSGGTSGSSAGSNGSSSTSTARSGSSGTKAAAGSS